MYTRREWQDFKVSLENDRGGNHVYKLKKNNALTLFSQIYFVTFRIREKSKNYLKIIKVS